MATTNRRLMPHYENIFSERMSLWKRRSDVSCAKSSDAQTEHPRLRSLPKTGLGRTAPK